MNCLINFLSDDNQKNMINMVQNRDETFEKELESYRRLFIIEKDYCIGRIKSNNETIAQYDNYCYNDDCICKDSCQKIHKDIQEIDNKEIERFFEGIRYCYLNWIDSKAAIALEAFDTLLKEYCLIDKGDAKDDENKNNALILKDIENRVFFRARLSDQFLSKGEIFHVPYNKRYNIRNERFSLTGQPLLYIGNSIADIVEELGLDINDFDSINKLRVSSFEFKNGFEEKRIFDLRCSIRHDLNNITHPTFSKIAFFRNILSEICSFQKRKELEDSAFKEEYVIPQMLALVLKQNNYDGICYYSTKKFNGYELDGVGTDISECDKNVQYRENVVLFTHMSDDGSVYSYDKCLFDSMEISMPIATNNVKLCSENDLDKLERTIADHYNNIKSIEKCSLYNIDCDNCRKTHSECPSQRLTTAKRCKEKATAIIRFYHKVFSQLRINNRPYSETQLGQIHIQLLIGILNRLLVESELPTNNLIENKINKKEINDDTLLRTCNLLGEVFGELKDYKYIHDTGKLHRAKVAFFYKTDVSNNDIMVAVLKLKSWDEMVYAHEEYDDDGFVKSKNTKYSNKISEYMNFDNAEVKEIGSFISKKTSIEERPNNEYGLSIDFEYITTEIIKWQEPQNVNTKSNDLEWKTISELEEIYINHYNKMSSIYRQSIPVLIKYFTGLKNENNT